MKSEIIMYHYVRGLENSILPKIKALELKKFIDQIYFLKKNYNIISMSQFLRKDLISNKPNCLLTFDDGYKDHYENVFDILIKNKISGSFFVPAEIVKKNNTLLDVNKIHVILASADEDTIFDKLIYYYNKLKPEISIEKYVKRIDLKSRFDTPKTILIKRLLQKALPVEIREKICDNLLRDFSDFSIEELNKDFYMTLDNAKEMASYGMHFGSHGKSHFWFESLNKSQQESEILGSLNFLNQIYQGSKFDLTICYPYGSYNKITLDLLKKYNFKAGFTTVPKKFDNNIDSFHTIPRYDTNDYYPMV